MVSFKMPSFAVTTYNNTAIIYPRAPPPGGGCVPPILYIFNIMPMGAAWKESTSNGLRPHNHQDVSDVRALVYIFYNLFLFVGLLGL